MAVKRFLRRWVPPLLWMALIFYLSAQPDLPSAPGPWLDRVVKKMGHAAAYGVLAWLYLRALRGSVRGQHVLRLLCWGLAVAYGLSDELHQVYVPGRTGRLSDVAIDAAGAGGAILLDWWLAHRRARALPPAAR